jgi:hypothetical protein
VRRRAGSSARDKAQANQLRKTMIPLLLALAGLLVVIGGLSAAMALGIGTFKDMAPSTSERAAILAFCAFPVAAVLAVGAAIFHREVKKTGKPK